MGSDKEKLHPTLRRQLKKVGLDPNNPPTSPQEWSRFLHRINQSYKESEQDRYLLERSLDVSSKEMMELNQRLIEQSESQLAGERDKLKAILTSLHEGLLVLDGEGLVRAANPAAVRLLEIQAEDLEGKPIFDRFFFGAESPSLRRDQQLRERVAKGEQLHFEDAHLLRRSGSKCPISLTLRPLEQRDLIMGIVCTFRNISHRKRAEKALRKNEEKLKILNKDLIQARDQAVEANRAKSRFLANMSHELRTPLNAIIGYSEMLVEDFAELEEAEFKGDLKRIRASANHLLSLLNNILDLSKVEAGKLDLNYEAIDIGPFLTDLVRVLDPILQKNDNHFELQACEGLGVLMADPLRLRQCLINLLSNASKFTKAGQIKLKASRMRQYGEDWLLFEVSDTGIGISQGQLQGMFEPFTQAEAHTARKYGGTGLGLAITRHFCELMGGAIEAESEVGVGTTFRICLPAQPIESVFG